MSIRTVWILETETGGIAKKVYRPVPCTAPIGLYTVPYRTAQKILHTVPYRYRRGFAVYRLAKYRCTAKIFLRVSKLESTHYYIYTQPELPVGNYNEGKDTEKLSLLVKLSTFLPQNAWETAFWKIFLLGNSTFLRKSWKMRAFTFRKLSRGENVLTLL